MGEWEVPKRPTTHRARAAIPASRAPPARAGRRGACPVAAATARRGARAKRPLEAAYNAAWNAQRDRAGDRSGPDPAARANRSDGMENGATRAHTERATTARAMKGPRSRARPPRPLAAGQKAPAQMMRAEKVRAADQEIRRATRCASAASMATRVTHDRPMPAAAETVAAARPQGAGRSLNRHGAGSRVAMTPMRRQLTSNHGNGLGGQPEKKSTSSRPVAKPAPTTAENRVHTSGAGGPAPRSGGLRPMAVSPLRRPAAPTSPPGRVYTWRARYIYQGAAGGSR